jgi:hypothetical protein
MLLERITKKKSLNEKNIITFASSCRHSCRSLYEFFYVIGLAAKAACTTTGLFLLSKAKPWGIFQKSILLTVRGMLAILRPSLMAMGNCSLGMSMGILSGLWIKMSGSYSRSLSTLNSRMVNRSVHRTEAAGNDLSQNRNKGGWKGITIPPKSLLNLLPRTATLSGKSLCRYSQRPNAWIAELCQGCCFIL